MNRLEEVLYRHRIALDEACIQADIPFEPGMDTGDMKECEHCGVWHKSHELRPDLDGSLICKLCEGFYGR